MFNSPTAAANELSTIPSSASHSYMSHFVPLHDRPPHYADPSQSSVSVYIPKYAAPDLDPALPLPPSGMSESESDEGYEDHPGQEGYQEQLVQEAGPSRKRPRVGNDEEHTGHSHNGHGGGHDNGHGHGHGQSHSSRSRPSGPPARRRQDVGIVPSFFGLSARNEFTKSIGEFILNAAHGKENVEVSSWASSPVATSGDTIE
jgi:hypothetical protein